ncbi:group III truncated hemoglobin [Marivirga sp. S37H4]|uniref:Group III truncated hemoglobin n=1 Tax=Marivirga aurantiaca TaxID=2802615 RepID=A0A935C6B4_9BACT|nr:group III truncated hemoglobin [Marivirga aurantiaca]MBK6264280.1 group III truncated hemoglobin [Marivirga aurantiaca]
MEPREILNINDIKELVDNFYGKVREDDKLADIFNKQIGDRWPEHLEKMYRFWQTILLGEHTYYGSPFAPHANLPVEKAHFERWIELFFQTIDENFTGDKAKEAKWRAAKMAEMFNYKIEFYRNNSSSPIT